MAIQSPEGFVSYVKHKLPPLLFKLLEDVSINIYIEENDLPDYVIDNEIPAEVNEEQMKINIYIPIIKKKENPDIELLLTVYHEMFHVFSYQTCFYQRLEGVLKGFLSDFLGITKKDVEEFLIDVEQFNVNEFIKSAGLEKSWNEDYIKECAEIDKNNGILKYITDDYQRGMIEDAFAETFARMIVGLKIDANCLPFEKLLQKFNFY
jgi:hypothetical protein